MRLLGLVELTSARTARLRDAELTRLRRVVGAPRPGGEHPPAVAHELIALADRVDDLLDDRAVAATTPALNLRWLATQLRALLALCEVAPIADKGAIDFLRHDVVADQSAPRPELVDHIAATVRPGYRWRHDLLRPQQVVAYVPADDHEGGQGEPP